MLLELQDALRKEARTKAIHRLGEITDKQSVFAAEAFATNFKHMINIVDATMSLARCSISLDREDKEAIDNMSLVFMQYKLPLLEFVKQLKWDGGDFVDFQEEIGD